MARILGIYIHIPFCRSKCDYCDFYSLAGKDEQMDAYQKALLAHIRQVAPLLKDYQVDSIYFGGGTPSYYGERRLREIFSTLRRFLTVSKTAEITLECNPDSVNKQALSRLRRSGFNRVSLGMQSADCSQLTSLHRPHDFAQVEAAVAAIREAKFENLSLDLIYGLPGQSLTSFQESLDAALALRPEHISAYGLKVEDGTPLHERTERGEILPDDDLQADMYLYLTRRLPKSGYRQYEISNFSKTGMESRHNLKYWMGREYIGFGPGAHSDLDGRRYAFRRDLDAYLNEVNNERDLLDSLEEITPAERAREYLICRMRTARGIEEWEYRREFTMNFEAIQHRLEFYETQGWAEQAGHRWRFTPEGYLRSNTLIAELLEAQGDAPPLGSVPPVCRLPLFCAVDKNSSTLARLRALLGRREQRLLPDEHDQKP